MTKTTRTSGISLLVDWANGQDHWVRALVGAVLQTRRSVGSDVVSELFATFLDEKGLGKGEGQIVSVPPIEHDANVGAGERALQLVKLSGVKNVNALGPRKEIIIPLGSSGRCE